MNIAEKKINTQRYDMSEVTIYYSVTEYKQNWSTEVYVSGPNFEQDTTTSVDQFLLICCNGGSNI